MWKFDTSQNELLIGPYQEMVDLGTQNKFQGGKRWGVHIMAVD